MSKEKIIDECCPPQSEPVIQAVSFMVEVIKRAGYSEHFLVRVPMPNGSMALACMGTRKEFDDFISGL